jgi:hypothetical protein
MEDDRMLLADQAATMLEVSAERSRVRAHLPPLHVVGTENPLSISFEMDAEAVDDREASW